MNRSLSYLLSFATVLLAACAPIQFSKVVTDQSNEQYDGYRVSLPEILLTDNATFDGNECNRNFTTVAIPSDRHQFVTFPPIVGSASVDVDIKDGWLFTGAKVETNTTDLVKEVIGKIIPSPTPAAATPNAIPSADGRATCTPKLFQIKNSDGNVVLKPVNMSN